MLLELQHGAHSSYPALHLVRLLSVSLNANHCVFMLMDPTSMAHDAKPVSLPIVFRLAHMLDAFHMTTTIELASLPSLVDLAHSCC